MEILKYLDVLLGLAVVMVLLSPLVTAFTQVWLWLFNSRSGRLQVGLESLLLQLNGSPYERFDSAEVTGLAPHQPALFAQPAVAGAAPPAPIAKVADEHGSLTLTENVPLLLAAQNGTLRPSLTLPNNAPLPPGVVIRLRPRGTVASWAITSSATDPNGAASLAYNFAGPAQFASRRAIAGLPPDTALSLSIASGAFKGTQLLVNGNVCSYPPHIVPVPSVHDLRLALTPPPAAPTQIVFTFERLLVDDGLPATGVLSAEDVKEVSAAVLLHPAIAQPPFLQTPARKGEVVEREEFIRILLEFAANPTNIAGMTKMRPGMIAAMHRLRQVLAGNDVPDPGRALADIREAAQVLELTDEGRATHERLTKAILTAAQSSFVGRINNWFDQVMDRTTAEYRFRAQLVTVIGALIVATLVQLDSIDLLKRLSSDDKLRDSLVQQAQIQEKRIDEQTKIPPASQNQDEIQNAKSQRDEIEGSLAKLRDPQLAVLPDHFLWQRLPQARLMVNPKWQLPYSQRLELVVGGSSYPLEPQWTSDPLSDIDTAIRDSGAPISTARDKQRTSYTITGPGVEKLHVDIQGIDRLAHVNGAAQAALNPGETLGAGQYTLLAGYDAVPLELTTGGADELVNVIKASKAPVSVLPPFTLQALKPQARWLQLRTRANDPSSNVLGETKYVDSSAHFDDQLFRGADQCDISGPGQAGRAVPCEAGPVAAALRSRGFRVDEDHGEQLLLKPRRLGQLQLRSVPGKPETNMLNIAGESSCNSLVCIDRDLLSSSWRGVLLTWILLSLGAPFWYDSLKDLLKLRSTLAKKEETARVERQTAAAPER
jgi:hypothetical protein